MCPEDKNVACVPKEMLLWIGDGDIVFTEAGGGVCCWLEHPLFGGTLH